MNNINLFVLPHFHGLIIEDIDTFVFEFEFVCRTYDYTLDTQTLNLFHSTLKESSLSFFLE